MMKVSGLVFSMTIAWAGAAQAQATPIGRAGLTSIDHVLLERELTLDDGVVELGGRVQTVQLDVGPFSASVTGIAATVGYGVGDVLEIWGEPVLFVDPQTELGLNLGASVRAVDGETFDMAPSVAVPIMITGDADTLPYMVLGLDSRVKLGEIVSLFFLHGLVMPAFSAETVIINLNLGLGVQPIEAFGIRLETRPLMVETAEGETTHYGDAVPLALDLIVNAQRVDFFFGMAFPSIENAGDLYVLTFGAMGRF